MTTFRLPDLGEGLKEAEIVAWHVGPGDHVVADQPLVSVETDKAVVEIPAPSSGTVIALNAATGDIVQVGEPIVELETGGHSDKGAIVGIIESEKPAVDKSPDTAATRSRSPGAKAVPAARQLAKRLDLDLASITGTGPGGVVTLSDVEAASGAAKSGEELRGTRRAMAAAMTASGATVVPATITDNADVSAWPESENIMTRLVHALVFGCKAEPSLNAHYNGRLRELLDRIDIAIAVDTPQGLFTPVLRDADRMDSIEAEIARLRQAVEDRTIKAAAMRNATITLSNFGPLGGEFASLVVTPPQVAILGAGRIAPACIVAYGKIKVGKILPLSLTFDHRVVTGGEAARFLGAVRGDLEKSTSDQGTER